MTLIQVVRIVSVMMFMVLFQIGCVANVSSQTRESDRDTSGQFDGNWLANVQKSAEKQVLPGNWVANCDGRPRQFKMRVAKGQIAFSSGDKEQRTFIDGEGQFRFDIPLNKRATSAGTSAKIDLNKRTLIIYGNLSKAKGRMTFGVAEFGNNGCTAIIKFAKEGAAT